MMAVSRGFVCVGSDQLNAIITHQSAHAAVTYKQANLLQFLHHPWSAITAKAEMVSGLCRGTVVARERYRRLPRPDEPLFLLHLTSIIRAKEMTIAVNRQ